MYLDKILAHKKDEIWNFKKKFTNSFFEKQIDLDGQRPFYKNLKQNPFSIIAEVKKASPSQGILSTHFNPVETAINYEKNGASAISVLTDKEFFQGDIDHLKQIHHQVGLPLLRKDFVIDEIQLLEAKAAGARAGLLIVKALDINTLIRLHKFCGEIELDALIEIHDHEELKKALDIGGEIIGINNRNLTTFAINLQNSIDLLPQIPKEVLRISESGIETKEDVQKLQKAGADGFLIGSAFMRDPSRLQTLLENCRES